jgi:hypothetical protein
MRAIHAVSPVRAAEEEESLWVEHPFIVVESGGRR